MENQTSASQIKGRVNFERTFETPEELLDVTADELACLVKDPSDSSKINFHHSAFKHPRECWDKVLLSKNFRSLSDVELTKLLMRYPGTKKFDPNSAFKDIERLKVEADCALEVELPTVEFFDEKSRCQDGISEFIVLSKLNYVAAMNLDANNDEETGKGSVTKSQD